MRRRRMGRKDVNTPGVKRCVAGCYIHGLELYAVPRQLRMRVNADLLPGRLGQRQNSKDHTTRLASKAGSSAAIV